MKKIVVLVLTIAMFLLAFPTIAQQPPPPKCEGPADMCAQIQELKTALEKQKAVSDAQDQVKDTKVAAEVAAADQAKEAKIAKLIAAAGVMAIMLKILLSMLKSWKDYFTSDKGKAWLKIISLLVGCIAFIISNIGFGIPWWQALMLASGGPGAILVHELIKLFPVIEGKAKYTESIPPAPGVPTIDESPAKSNADDDDTPKPA